MCRIVLKNVKLYDNLLTLVEEDICRVGQTRSKKDFVLKIDIFQAQFIL